MAHITIPDADPTVTYLAKSVVGPHIVPFPVFAAEDIRVTVAGVEVYGFTFTSTGTVVGGYQTGYITLAVAPVAQDIVIWRDIPIRRTDDFATGPLDMPMLNTALDRLTAYAQDMALRFYSAYISPSAAAILAAIAGHVAQTDPHPQYTRQAFRNRLLNPAFAINQTGATNLADGGYTFDGYAVLTESGNVTVGALTNPENGHITGIRLTQPDAGPKRIGLVQVIENADVADLRGVAAAMAARIRCSVSQVIRMAILEHTGAADATTRDVVLAWANGSYTSGQFFIAGVNVIATGATTPVAATWTDMTQITGPFGAAMNNAIVFVWTEGTLAQNGTLDFDQMQLEVGASCGQFQRPAIAQEIVRCERLFEKSFAMNTAPVQNVGSASGASKWTQNVGASSSTTVDDRAFRVRKRTTPTMTFFNPSAANAQARNGSVAADCSATTLFSASDTNFAITYTTGAGTSATSANSLHWTADARLP